MKALSIVFLLLSSPGIAQTSDEAVIRQNIADFSTFVVNRNVEAIANAYTADASIFPNGYDIIKGTEGIARYWTPKEGNRTTFHKIYPVEIVVQGNTAYDHGYYEVSGVSQGSAYEKVRGKYVIVWKKVGTEWKIYLDIWNRVN